MKQDLFTYSWKSASDPNGKVPIYPYERGEILTKLNRLDTMVRLKGQHKNICRIVEDIEAKMTSWKAPKNPREDLIQQHDKKTLQVLKRQKEHLEKQMALLEAQIRKDIEESKME